MTYALTRTPSHVTLSHHPSHPPPSLITHHLVHLIYYTLLWQLCSRHPCSALIPLCGHVAAHSYHCVATRQHTHTAVWPCSSTLIPLCGHAAAHSYRCVATWQHTHTTVWPRGNALVLPRGSLLILLCSHVATCTYSSCCVAIGLHGYICTHTFIYTNSHARILPRTQSADGVGSESEQSRMSATTIK